MHISMYLAIQALDPIMFIQYLPVQEAQTSEGVWQIISIDEINTDIHHMVVWGCE